MKNQYFGDTRDLLKYDLALELLLRCNLSRLTFIPMLTRDEPNTHGSRTDYGKTIGRNTKSCIEKIPGKMRGGRPEEHKGA